MQPTSDGQDLTENTIQNVLDQSENGYSAMLSMLDQEISSLN